MTRFKEINMAPFLLGCLLVVAPPAAVVDPKPAIAEKLSGEELILLDILTNQLKSPDPRIRHSAIVATNRVFRSIRGKNVQVKKAGDVLIKILKNKREKVEYRSFAMNTLFHAECCAEKTTESCMKIILDTNDGLQARAMVFAGLLLTPASKANFFVSELCHVYCDSEEHLAIRLS